MPSSFEKRFSQDEIARMRQIAGDEDGLGASLFETLRRVARSLPFSVDVLAAWYCTRDPATPTRVRVILLSALAYFVLPFDSIPDLLPFLGFTDDAAVIAAAIASVASHLRPEHREQARKTLEGERFE
jgi:uncharacterized membrane protein YkvA (DUF1232 family)